MLVPLLVAGLVVAGAQVVRAMFPLMYLLGEDRDFLVAGGVALAVYTAPFLAVALPWRGASAIVVGAGGVAAGLMAVAVSDQVSTALAMSATAVVLAGAALVLSGLAGRSWSGGGDLAAGLLLGLAADTALRAPSAGWDLVWHEGVAALAVLVVVAAAVVALAVQVAGQPKTAPTGGAWRRAGAWLAGPYLALQLLFLQNPAYLASQADLSWAAATAVVLAGDALALAALFALLHRRPPVGVPASAGVAAAVLAATVGRGSTALVVAGVLALQVIASLGVASALAQVPSTRTPSPRRARAAVGAASVSFLLLILLWQLHIDRPLPFPRATVPTLAAALVAGAAVRRAPQPPGRARLAAPLGVVVAVTALLLPAALRSDPTPAPTGPIREVRIVSYNVRGALDTDGQLRPDVVAAEIASSRPDVVVLQEVARGWPIFGAADLLSWLADRLDMDWRYEPAADGQFGNAVLSRLPLTELDAGRLPRAGNKQQRSFLAVSIDAGGIDLTVVGTHLESHATAQIDAVLDVLADRAPAVLAGDLNVKPGDPEATRFAGLVDAVATTGDSCRTTSAQPTSACDRPDWVLLTPDLTLNRLTIGTASASDHLPIHLSVALPSSP